MAKIDIKILEEMKAVGESTKGESPLDNLDSLIDQMEHAIALLKIGKAHKGVLPDEVLIGTFMLIINDEIMKPIVDITGNWKTWAMEQLK